MVGDAGIEECVEDRELTEDAGCFLKAPGGFVPNAMGEGAEAFRTVEQYVSAFLFRVAAGDP